MSVLMELLLVVMNVSMTWKLIITENAMGNVFTPGTLAMENVLIE